MKDQPLASLNRTHGLICSPKVMDMLKNKCESITGTDPKSIIAFQVMPIYVEKKWPDDNMLILDKEMHEVYRRDGMDGLLLLMWRKGRRSRSEHNS